MMHRGFVFVMVMIGMLAGAVSALGCQPGVSQCVDLGSFQNCTEFAVLGPVQACPVDTECMEGVCNPKMGCQPGVSECLDTTTYHVCGNYAIWDAAQSCALGQTCASGQCVGPTPVCSPNQFACVGGSSFHICDSNGQWGVLQYCPGGQICSNNACVNPSPAPQCSRAGDNRCSPYDGKEVQICNWNYQWEDYRRCERGCRNGRCQECYDGERTCSDTLSYQVCDRNGYWSMAQTCPSYYVCRSGVCQVSPAGQCSQYGQKRCSFLDSSMLQMCGSNGAWQDSQVCRLGCKNGDCAVCRSGETRCADDSGLQTCGSDGQWNASVRCSSGMMCQQGQCQAKPENRCSPDGGMRCSPDKIGMVQRCAQGVFGDYLNCPIGCVNGQCMQCQPGASVCAGAYQYRICGTDGQLSDARACPTNYTCDGDGKCMATPVCAEGQQNCVSGTVYACKSGQWSLLYQCPDDKDCAQSNGMAYCVAENRSAVQPANKSDGFFSGNGPLLLAALLVFGGAVLYFFTKLKKE